MEIHLMDRYIAPRNKSYENLNDRYGIRPWNLLVVKVPEDPKLW